MLDACFISIPPSLSRCLTLYLLSLLLSQSGYSKPPAPFLCSELLSLNYASSFSIPRKKKQTTSSNSSLIDQGHSRHTQHFISFLGRSLRFCFLSISQSHLTFRKQAAYHVIFSHLPLGILFLAIPSTLHVKQDRNWPLR